MVGGYNRRGFIRNTERFLNAVSDRTQYAVLFFNIKNFKDCVYLSYGDYSVLYYGQVFSLHNRLSVKR